MSMACDVLIALAAAGGRVARKDFMRLLKSVGIDAGGSVGSLRSELTRRRLIRPMIELTDEGRALLAKSSPGRELLGKIDAAGRARRCASSQSPSPELVSLVGQRGIEYD